jgi:hypothetical protein
MKGTTLFICAFLLLSGCKASRNMERTYNESEGSAQETETEKRESEESTGISITGKETKTAEVSETTEFFPPTLENPSGGAPKTSTRKIYVTDDKATNILIEEHKKEIYEKDKIISELQKKIESLELEKTESDSRPIQGGEWVWAGISFCIVAAIVCLAIYVCKKKNTILAWIMKKIF